MSHELGFKQWFKVLFKHWLGLGFFYMRDGLLKMFQSYIP